MRRLHIVTGKGGTGKSTVAAALALALAYGGNKVLLAEAEGRQGIAQMFDVAPLPYAEKRVAVAPGGGDVYALAIDPEAALLEYLDIYYRLGRAGKALDRFGAIDFATTIAPGLRDVLLTGKLYEAVRRRVRKGHEERVYDAVVLDAPPTGRITRFLNVNAEMAGLARVGPVHHQADSIMTMLRSQQTAVHLVTVLEEMPVQETADTIGELTETRLPLGSVVVNLLRRGSLDDRALAAAEVGRLPAEGIRAGLEAAGLGSDPESTSTVVNGLQALGQAHAERALLEQEQRRVVDKLGLPVVELPRLNESIDLGCLYELAEDLREGGLA
ncbi:MAG TPA: ArsA-related P-loop ATPase [Nocardioidaceae bacterium]|nr:ArsA-related P-loop ATPase [Nocardioidaceae bacterium]